MSIKSSLWYGSVLLFLLCSSLTQGQPVFTYGNSSVDKTAFLRAYAKNNPDQEVTERSIRDYLELLIRFKLKVKEAYAKKLDTLPNQKAELAEFRRQIAENFLRDDNGFRDLVQEAFTRSQLDINIAYVFIPAPSIPGKKGQSPDTSAGRKLAMNAYNELQNGGEFNQVVARYVTGADAKTNSGNPGFVTVFTLPYDLENIVYALPVGGVSKPFFRGSGYYLFKNLATRKAVGKRKVRQVLLAIPPDADSSLVTSMRRKADSMYQALVHGVPFDSVTSRFWYAGLASGELPVFGVGTYEPAFEQAVFALQKDGDITRPLRTALGFHIVEQMEAMPVDTDALNEASLEILKQQVAADPRMNLSKDKLLAAVKRSVTLKTNPVNETALWQFADSAFAGSKTAMIGLVNNNTVLFSIGGMAVTVEDWINSMRARNRNAVPASQQYRALLLQFKDDIALAYYQDHLEAYNEDFATQVQEFREGNLLFEIMQRTIWDGAAADSLALKKYYDSHRSKYFWLPGAEAVIFTARDSVAAFSAYAIIRQSPGRWRDVLAGMGDRVQADSGRFELAQLSMASLAEVAAGTVTLPRRVSGSDGYVFSYLIRPYKDQAPRSFEDAMGFVTNDYQGVLEEEWVNRLKIKYPVKINEAMVQTLYKAK